jgi:hypothetical protein
MSYSPDELRQKAGPPAPPRPRVRPEAVFRRLLEREAPFAGLHALSNLARARWALDFAIERLRRGGPLSTRLEFVEAKP